MDIYQALENWKEKYLSPFCINICGGHCCKIENVKIKVNKKQIDEIKKITERPNLDLTKDKVDNEPEMFWIKTYEDSLCPHCLAFDPDTKLCKIQHQKPEMCLQFPLIIKEKEEEIILHHRCWLSETRGKEIEELRKICLKYNYSLYIE